MRSQLGRVGTRHAAVGREGLRGFRPQVADVHGVAGAAQRSGHAAAHRAQADHADVHPYVCAPVCAPVCSHACDRRIHMMFVQLKNSVPFIGFEWRLYALSIRA